MRLAYLVMAHQRPGQLARLVSHLKRSGDVFIHIDRKATERFYGLEECRVLPDPVAVYWSNWSHVVAEFNLAQAALPERYDYYCLLSGQCFPIKPLEHLEAYLRANAPAEHIRYIPAADWPECLVRFDKHFFEPRTLVARAVNRIVPHLPYRRELPLGLKPFNGWQWWALTHECLGHVVEAFRLRPELTGFFRYGKNAEETAIQTVIGNSPFADRVSSAPLHEIEFRAGSPHPRIWTCADLPRLAASSAFFARKFDERVDAAVLDRLAEHINH